MKWVWRVGGALVALVAVALIALAVALPRIAGSDAVRTRVETAARDALGRELRFERLEAGLFPPALRAVAVQVAGEKPKDPPLLEAKEVSLRLALLPLLARTLAIDSLAVESATLRLTRTRDGLQLPKPPDGGAKAPAGAAAGSGAPAGSDSDSGLGLALRGMRLRDTTLVLTDRAVTPPVTWELRELDASARGRLLGDGVDVEADTALASGGTIHVEGSSSLAGELDLDVELRELALAPLASYVEGAEGLHGTVSGTAHVKGPAADPEHASAELTFGGALLTRGDLRVAGPLLVKAELERPLQAPLGSFSADAEGAEILSGAAFRKPPGTQARVSGRLVPGQGGALAIEDLAVALRNLTLRGRVAQLSPLRAELHADAFDVDGWGELLPGLAESAPSGRMSVESLAYSAEPQSLNGRIQVDRLELQREGSPLQVRGALVAQGQSIVLEDGALAAGQQSVGLSARLDDLFGAPRYDVALETSGADANQVMTALAGRPDTLFGLLGMQARFTGPVGGDPLRSLEGRAGFGVDDGRLVGVSLLRSAFEGIGEAGTLALALGREFGGRDLQRFYGDAFETLRGTFDVRGGVARTDDLTFAYRGYSVVLRGTLGLADLKLDTEGELTIDPALDAEIADQLKLKNYTPTRRTLPLAAVKGTLDAPKVRLSSRAAGALVAAYAQPGYAGELKEKAEKALGKDGGAAVEQGLDILNGLLGGGRREKRTEEPPGETSPQSPDDAPSDSPAAPPEPQ